MEPLRMLGPKLFGIQVPQTLMACDSFYPRVNLGYGEYLRLAGADAEAAMVRDAISAVGLRSID
jgi:hypothetical protein